MTRSHPPTLITLARRTLLEVLEALEGSSARILVAVSGGPDSMALLHVLGHLRKHLPLQLTAHGIDHGLRPAAVAELAMAGELAASLAIPFRSTRVDVAPGGNLQARARDARYAALHEAAREDGADLVATAHHADDRAETVLLRLIRGTGPRGLAVLPALSGSRVRPFLRARRADVLAHLERHHIAFAVDPSNDDPRFTRVRVRHEVLPLLTRLNPNVVDHLCALADRLLEGGHGAGELAQRENAGEASEATHSHALASTPVSPRWARLDGARARPLPRATQLALRALGGSSSTKSAVELPGGVVATYDREHRTIVVKASGSPGWKHRVRDGRHRNES